MNIRHRLPRVIVGTAAVLLILAIVYPAGAQLPPPPPPAVKFLRLEELERLALANNPTVAQADAIVRAVLGRKQQASFYPNPLVGFSAEDLKARTPSQSKYFLWAQQTIVTGDKRKLLQAAVAQEQVHAGAGPEPRRPHPQLLHPRRSRVQLRAI